MKCFDFFVQLAVNARRKGDENPNSSVVAKIKKLLANISYGYHNMDWSRHTLKKYHSDENTYGAINNEMFNHLGYQNDQLYELEIVITKIEHKTPILLDFLSCNMLNSGC